MRREIFRSAILVLAAATQVEAVSVPPPQALRLKRFAYVDREGLGCEALSLLIPSDWRFEGGIRWALDQPAMPGVLSFRVSDPQGTAELEVFPNRMFTWSTDPSMQAYFPAGSRYLGTEVVAPMPAQDYLRRVIVPQFRGQASGLRVLDSTPLPGLGKHLEQPPPMPGATASSDAAKLRVEYTRNGAPMEEEIYVILQYVNIPMPGFYGSTTNTIWTADYQFSFKTRKGEMNASRKMFQTMLASFRFDMQWFNKYNQLVQMLTQQQIQRINHIGELSRYISRTNNEISDMIRDSYERQQATYDKVYSDFSQHIRGVDSYYDPIQEKPVELPSGYTEAWTNALGEYIVSDSPNYNPNIGSTGNWQRMEKK